MLDQSAQPDPGRDPGASAVPQVELISVVIAHNSVEVLTGGGINCEVGDITLVGGLIHHNSVTNDGGKGGGLHLGKDGVLIAQNTPTVSYNSATTGDGIDIKEGGLKSGATNYIDDAIVDENPA